MNIFCSFVLMFTR